MLRALRALRSRLVEQKDKEFQALNELQETDGAEDGFLRGHVTVSL